VIASLSFNPTGRTNSTTTKKRNKTRIGACAENNHPCYEFVIPAGAAAEH
jgi:hypothetical protein